MEVSVAYKSEKPECAGNQPAAASLPKLEHYEKLNDVHDVVNVVESEENMPHTLARDRPFVVAVRVMLERVIAFCGFVYLVLAIEKFFPELWRWCASIVSG